MTWCSKIYGIFNGWNAEQNELPTIESSGVKRINSNFYRHEIEVNHNHETVIQHDSPFQEKSDTLVNTPGPNEYFYSNNYLTNRDYRGEHICADTLFSCHQRDGQFYYNPTYPPYGIATISNTSLNLPQYIASTENPFQRQLSRRNSFELPMESKRNQQALTSLNNVTPRMRYSLNQQSSRQRLYAERSNRLSLNHTTMTNSQVSLRNREETVGHRISTRSSRSIPDYQSNELQSRNNEQVEQEVQKHVKQMLELSPSAVFPMIYRLPGNEMLQCDDGYRIEGGYGESSKWMIQTKIDLDDCYLQSDSVASIYANHFYDQFHINLYAIDNDFNPIVMSVKPQGDRLIVIVRTKESSKFMEETENGTNTTDYVSLANTLYPHLHIDHFETCTNIQAQGLIKAFDDKLETQKFKFGIIYQRKGQTTEEEFFNNEKHSQAFEEFLNIIATRVALKNFKGYRGGLDVSEQTDSPVSYYECLDHKEIMFHVSTLLPFTPNDYSQIQRKRHIGNDIVTIIFQEENTPFHPSMIKSNFLHVFLVIQPAQILSRTCYKIMLVARDDIVDFPPFLQPNLVYVRTAEHLKAFVLSKLINAEYAAYRCGTFSLLQERTRCSYLKTLCENLTEKSYENLCDEQKRVGNRRSSVLLNSTRKRYLSSVKKIFSRSNTIPDGARESIKSDQGKVRPSKKLLRMGKSMDSVEDYRRSLVENDLSRETNLMHRSSNGRSDESLDSSGEITSSTIQNYHSLPVPVYHGDESDEGLDSMSSVDTARAHYDSDDTDGYRQQLREKSQPSKVLWHRSSTQRRILMPQTAGIHISEEATV